MQEPTEWHLSASVPALALARTRKDGEAQHCRPHTRCADDICLGHALEGASAGEVVSADDSVFVAADTDR